MHTDSRSPSTPTPPNTPYPSPRPPLTLTHTPLANTAGHVYTYTIVDLEKNAPKGARFANPPGNGYEEHLGPDGLPEVGSKLIQVLSSVCIYVYMLCVCVCM